MANINLLTAQIAHEVDLQRVASGLGGLSTKHLNAISKYVRETLLVTETITTIKQRNQLIKDISAFMTDELGAFTADMTEDLGDIIVEEVGFQASTVATATGAKIVEPAINKVIKVIKQKPLVLNGKAIGWDEYIEQYAPNQVKAVSQIITAGWSNGETTRLISQQITGTNTINGVMQTSQRSAYMMAKDLTTHQSSMAKAEVGKANQDVIIGEKVIVTLDSKTSPICQKLGSQDKGGKEFIYAKVGHNFSRAGFHRWCRSIMVFILAPEFKEFEAGRTRPAVINGVAVQVDAETNWMDIAKSNEEFAEISLGKTKAALLDEMSAKEFTKAAYNRLGEAQTIESMKESSKTIVRLLE